eukprot:TRINITY_DN5237_c0_g1_i1.p1 TRINITY_DN5237_c0_g1~~TRINITY_DN5237_c0_g1_i1.p1  ORF type:complete len:543 (-),score=112.52 TRINITY_DN5237_c0_g1_i1:113-1741(-)
MGEMNIHVTFGADSHSVSIRPTANVYDLKQAISRVTGVAVAYQNILGLAVSGPDLTNDLPLVALGVVDNTNLLILDDSPSTGETTSLPSQMDTSPSPSPTTPPTTTTTTTSNNNESTSFASDLGDNYYSSLTASATSSFPAAMDIDESGPTLSPSPVLAGSSPSPPTSSSISPPSSSAHFSTTTSTISSTANLPAHFGGQDTAYVPADFYRLLSHCTVETELWQFLWEEKWGSSHPIFLGGEFSTKFRRWREKLQFGIVNLHDDSISNSDFNSVVLSRPELSAFLSKHKLGWWIGELSPEAKTHFFQTTHRHVKTPLVALVGYVEGAFKILTLINETVPLEELMSRLLIGVESYKHCLDDQRAEIAKRERTRLIKEEQNAAFQESLQADAEKKATASFEAETAKIQQTSKLSMLAMSRAKILERATQVPEEPPKGVAGSARFAVRLSDGTRLQRLFIPTDTLENLYDWVSSTIASTLTDETFLDLLSPPLDDPSAAVIPWNPLYFDFVSNYPKQTFTFSQKNSTLEQLGLSKGGMLFFQHNQ